MEQHPIPQDVTGFQFKLIGAMTVKQFGFVAVGAILAVVSWYVPVQGFLWNFVTKAICVPIFGLSGVIIAFVPIEGRPVDVMAANFFRAMTSPNQYIYIKRGKKFSFTQMTFAKIQPAAATAQKTTPEMSYDNKKEQQLRALLSSGYKDAKSSLDKKEMQFLQSITAIPVPNPAAETTTSQSHIPELPKPSLHFTLPALPKINTPPPAQMHPAPLAVNSVPPAVIQKPAKAIAQPAVNDTPLSPQQTQDINAQNILAEQEILKIKNQQMLSPQPVAARQTANTPFQDPAHVRNIPQNLTKSAGFSHIPDSPNLIVGIVKDARANMLPNILVEIKDNEGNPVRAFKTNPLGQFASATPLTNGSYTIELEDPKKQHAFNIIQIKAEGQIMLPIEIISHDAREELRQALFN